jgi:hypothetical protein
MTQRGKRPTERDIYQRQDVPNILLHGRLQVPREKKRKEKKKDKGDTKRRHYVLVELTLTTAYIYIKDAGARVDALSGS